MPISPGTRLGPYEVSALLGAGGMGEVYRARDTKLGRDVALKILPSEVSGDPERRRRFEAEARSASALNHPNIVTVYDIGASDSTIYVAMELVDGKTLRELILAEPLGPRRLLEIAVQVADGLAKAHTAGIVHRDLKPENLMVSKDGYVKILDFGLAKLVEPLSGSEDSSALPTMAAPATQPGTVLGTAGYMSPEQASGGGIDFRSDQFAFGAILYEMATGRRAFQRKTGAETLAAIIREEPEPVGQLNPNAPAPLRWMVERCLAKDPEERYASSKDLARDLRSVRDHLSEASGSGAAVALAPLRSRRPGWLLPVALSLLVGAGLGILLGRAARTRPDSPATFQRLTFQRGAVYSARFAPDGQTIVYGASWEGRPREIFSTRADSLESRSLGLPTADVLSMSPAGEMAISLGRHYLIGFESGGTLARMALGGGAPRAILENVQDADWSPDGKSLVVARRVGELRRLEYPVGKVLYQTNGWTSHIRFSPDGELVAFIDHPLRGDSTGSVKVIDTTGKLRLQGPPADTGLAWSARGDEVWSTSEKSLQATSLSGNTRIVWAYPGVGSIQDIARDGSVLFVRTTRRREVIGLAPGETAERNLSWLDWSFPSDISSDGRLLLFDEQSRGTEKYLIYLRPTDGSPAVLLGEGRSLGLSPDGRWALTSPAVGSSQLTLLPTGAGEAKALPATNIQCQWATWFPDGRRILVSGNEPGRGLRLYVRELPDGKPRAITPEGVSAFFSSISPDGKRIVATGADRKVSIYPVEPGESVPVPGVAPDELPVRWSADGRSIYILRWSEPTARVYLLDIETGHRTPWKELRPPDPAGVISIGPIVITPDGKSYVYSYRRSLEDLYLVKGLR